MSMSLSFQTANLLRRKAIYRGWHRYQQRCQILRAQLGFDKTPTSRPETCIGCTHYHGRAYGQTRMTRTLLICGFHPYGWLQDSPCPDSKEEEGKDEWGTWEDAQRGREGEGEKIQNFFQ